jgi:hypothetical protein
MLRNTFTNFKCVNANTFPLNVQPDFQKNSQKSNSEIVISKARKAPKESNIITIDDFSEDSAPHTIRILNNIDVRQKSKNSKQQSLQHQTIQQHRLHEHPPQQQPSQQQPSQQQPSQQQPSQQQVSQHAHASNFIIDETTIGLMNEMKRMFENETSLSHSLLRIDKNIEISTNSFKEFANGIFTISNTLKDMVSFNLSIQS